MSRIQRTGLVIAAAGLAVTFVGIVVLQFDPLRLDRVQEVLHRAGQVLMLLGLIVFLAASVIGRHRERLRRAVRAVSTQARLSPSGAQVVQQIGGALMFLAIGGSFLLSLVPGVPFFAIFVLLRLAGLLGAVLWITGLLPGVLSSGTEFFGRRPASRPPEPHLRAAPSFGEWTEAPPETIRAD